MRISKIELKNVLCFRHLELSVHEALQLLAGPNNAGKSSCVRAVEAFFSDPGSAELMEMLPRNAYFQTAGARILSTITVSFSDLTDQERETFKPILKRDRTIWLSIRCSRSGRVSYAASKSVSRDTAHDLYTQVVNLHHLVKIPSVRVGGSGDPEGLGSLDRLLDTLEAALVRRAPGASSGKQQAFAEKATALEDVVREVLDESARRIHEELPFRDGEVRFRLPHSRFALRGMLEAAEIESVDDGATVPVSQRGTGFQSALVLGILRYVASQERLNDGYVVFAVEEPEAFLHPQTQRAMAAILRDICKEAQLLVTTHSSVVVDSFEITQIARLPLSADGTTFSWAPPDLPSADAGRLTRYCDAANSELVFASAVILVEGEGDKQLIEHLLEELCQTPGGFYARGITVIDVGGKANFQHLAQLAQNFGVRPFMIADKDAVSKGGRMLLAALHKLADGPDQVKSSAIRDAADIACDDYLAARAAQRSINGLLEPHGAFVLSSDMEGMIVDALGAHRVLEALGQEDPQAFSAPYIDSVQAAENPATTLKSRLGSKGWNADDDPTGKVKPHLPRAVVNRAVDPGDPDPEEMADLKAWLGEVLDHASTAAV